MFLNRKLQGVFLIILIISMTPVFALNYSFSSEVVSKNNMNFVPSNQEFSIYVQSDKQIYLNETYGLQPCDNVGSSLYECQIDSIASSEQIVITNNSTDEIIPITADALSPLINLSSLELQGNTLKIDYSVIDPEPSSGIKQINFFLNNQLIKTILPDSSNKTGTLEINVPAVSNNNIVSITATDNCDNYQYADSNFGMDINSPIIEDDFKLLYGDQEIDKIAINPARSIIVNLAVFIDEDNLSLPIYADLRDLNNIRSQSFGYNHFPTRTCSKIENNVYKCVFRNIKLHSPDAELKISVWAKDTNNNVAVKNITKTFFVTGENSVEFIGSNQSCLTKCYLRNTNIFLVKIRNEGGSFNALNVPIKFNNQKIFPAFCNQEDDLWLCNYVLEVPTEFANRTVTIRIDRSASDDYGNSLGGINSNRFIVDMDPPKIDNSSLELKLNGETSLSSICVTPQDTLNINFNAFDALSEALRVTVSSELFSSDIHFQCDKGHNFNCNIDINNINNMPKGDYPVTITVKDVAGNKDTLKFDLASCYFDPDTLPHFANGVETPDYNSFVDSRVASYSAWKHLVPISFNLDQDTVLNNFEVTNCFAVDTNTSYDFVDQYYVIDKTPTKGDLLVYIKGSDIHERELDLNCTLALYGYKSGVRYVQPQTLSFTVPLDFKYASVNGFDEAIQKKIEQSKKKLRSLDKQLKTRKAINTGIHTTCLIGKYAGKMNAALQYVFGALYLIAKSFGAGMIAKGIASTSKQINDFVTTWFWPPGGIELNFKDFSTGKVFKVICAIDECAYYRTDFLSKIVFSSIELFKKDDSSIKPANQGIKVPESHVVSNDDSGPTVAVIKNVPHSNLFLQTYSALKSLLYSSNKNRITGNVNFIDEANKYLYPDNYYPFVDSNADEIIKNMKDEYGINIYGYGSYRMPILLPVYRVVDSNIKTDIVIDDEGDDEDVVIDESIPETVLNTHTEQSDENLPPLTKDSLWAEAGKAAIDIKDEEFWSYAKVYLVNPYRSRYFDSLCLSAVVFNLEKEKQIECMYLKCLNQAQESGQSSISCDLIKKYRTCLYLTSAQYKLGNNNLWTYFFVEMFKNLFKAMLTNSLYMFARVLCADVYSNNIFNPANVLANPNSVFKSGGMLSKFSKLFSNNLLDDARIIICGVSMGWIAYINIKSFFNKDSYSFKTADLGDNCEGLEYNN